jgi:hypothetical protein
MFPKIEERRVKDHGKKWFTTAEVIHTLREAEVLSGQAFH